MLTPIRTIPNLSKHQHTVSLLNGSCSVVKKSLSKKFLYTPLHSQKCMLLIKTTFSTDNSETWLTSTEEIVSKTKYLCWQFLKGVLFPNEHYEKGFQRARFFFCGDRLIWNNVFLRSNSRNKGARDSFHMPKCISVTITNICYECCLSLLVISSWGFF